MVKWTIYSCCNRLLSSSCLSCSTVCCTLAFGAHQTKQDKGCSTPAESLIKRGLPSQSDTFLQAPNSSPLAVTVNPIIDRNNKIDTEGAAANRLA